MGNDEKTLRELLERSYHVRDYSLAERAIWYYHPMITVMLVTHVKIRLAVTLRASSRTSPCLF